MEKDKKESDHEASWTSGSNSEEVIDLELRLGPSRKYIRSSSSSESRHNGGIIIGVGGGGSGACIRKTARIGGGGADIPKTGGMGGGAYIPTSLGIGAFKPKDVGFGVGLGIPEQSRGGGGGTPPIHGGGGFAIPNHPGSGGGRRNSRLRVRAENVVDVAVPPFEWATNKFAQIHSRDHLISNGIHTITGEVQCKKCEHRCTLEFDLQSKLLEVGSFIYHNKENLAHRAPDNWMTPRLETCASCDQPNSLKPIIPSDKGMINWLFLLLGQMIGCCTLEQLKFFCDKNSQHRTGAKDRLIFLTYLSLCKQLDPNGPFELDGS